ncbi:uncharacterized protein LOC143359463 [Halictus rubicundus]|uniref:uncharacterized protein LOC143359463 n=1 Tax=Halictus rubicundus TaxID=77578 RepID=UPI00403513E8
MYLPEDGRLHAQRCSLAAIFGNRVRRRLDSKESAGSRRHRCLAMSQPSSGDLGVPVASGGVAATAAWDSRLQEDLLNVVCRGALRLRGVGCVISCRSRPRKRNSLRALEEDQATASRPWILRRSRARHCGPVLHWGRRLQRSRRFHGRGTRNHHRYQTIMKIYWRLLCVSLLCLGAGRVEGLQRWGSQFGKAPLLERFFWKTLDFAYPDEASRQMAMMRGDFVPENALPVGIEIWRNKLFVTVPRWRNGIPATLNYISLDTNRGGSPRLTPYPNWAQNKAGACGTGMTTAYRIHADACDRLWVLDTGTIGIGNTTVQACPYTLNVFDLTTDKISRQYRLRPEDINMVSLS